MIGTNKTVAVHHAESSGGATSYEDTPSISGLRCYIEKLAPEGAILFDFGSNAMGIFKLFADAGIDIRVGDKIVDQNDVTYFVRQFAQYDDNSEIPNHSEYILTSS